MKAELLLTLAAGVFNWCSDKVQLTYQRITHLESEVKRLVAPHSDHQTSRKLCDHIFGTIGHQQMSKHMVHEESSGHIRSVTFSVLHEQYLISFCLSHDWPSVHGIPQWLLAAQDCMYLTLGQDSGDMNE